MQFFSARAFDESIPRSSQRWHSLRRLDEARRLGLVRSGLAGLLHLRAGGELLYFSSAVLSCDLLLEQSLGGVPGWILDSLSHQYYPGGDVIGAKFFGDLTHQHARSP